jgi:hypothetical protein
MSAEQNKFISDAIIDLLPDAPDKALTILALTFANAVVATGCSDEAAHKALTISLRQMRAADRSEPCLSPAEQKAQGARCGCRGADDYCVCQNVPDAVTRAARREGLPS